jgi:hypothetical protein
MCVFLLMLLANATAMLPSGGVKLLLSVSMTVVDCDV